MPHYPLNPPYSLTHRFHGALLGSMIGWQSNSRHSASSPTSQQLQTQLEECTAWICDPHVAPAPKFALTEIESTIALLPLWLYYHESWRQRLQQLQKLPQWQTQPTVQSSLWLYGEAIAQMLRTDCNPTNLIPNLLQQWQKHSRQGASACTTKWQQHLEQIHQWQHTAFPLTMIRPGTLGDSPIEQAISLCLYNFLTASHAPSVAFARCDQLSTATIAITTRSLLGGLLGAYFGWSGWSAQAISAAARTTAIASAPDNRTYQRPTKSSRLPLYGMSQRLMQSWSGAVSSTDADIHYRQMPTVISPR